MRRPEIDFDPIPSDARRDRTERAVLARLAAIQAVGTSDSVLLVAPRSRRWIAIGAATAAAAAAIVIAVVSLRGAGGSDPAPATSQVVTPPGASSQFTVGDSVIEAGGDTSVDVARGDGGATTLVLARGSVDCDVAPRHGRPPFRVVAGDVAVEVVGTRFKVARTGATVRVDVTRGKVRVRAHGEERVLEAGGTWTPGALATAEPPPAAPPQATAPPEPATEPELDMPPEAVKDPGQPRATAPSPRAAFAAAQRLESKDRNQAARAYRAIANGSDVWASLALYSLAELHATAAPGDALRDLDELVRRFPRGANAEDAAWLRVDVLRKLHRAADARAAAAAYLNSYPSGTYAKAAAHIASP